MGRKSVLVGFWLVGYVLGFFAWMVKGPMLQFMESFGLGADVAQGIIAGLFGSTVMILGVLVWSFFSSSS
jgi:hypothetical protein